MGYEKNLESKGFTSEPLVVILGQTSKTADIIFLITVSVNNQPVPYPMVSSKNKKCYGDVMDLGL